MNQGSITKKAGQNKRDARRQTTMARPHKNLQLEKWLQHTIGIFLQPKHPTTDGQHATLQRVVENERGVSDYCADHDSFI